MMVVAGPACSGVDIQYTVYIYITACLHFGYVLLSGKHRKVALQRLLPMGEQDNLLVKSGALCSLSPTFLTRRLPWREFQADRLYLHINHTSIARLAQSVERETLKVGQSQGCGFDPRIGLMEKYFFQQLPSSNPYYLVPCWLYSPKN